MEVGGTSCGFLPPGSSLSGPPPPTLTSFLYVRQPKTLAELNLKASLLKFGCRQPSAPTIPSPGVVNRCSPSRIIYTLTTLCSGYCLRVWAQTMNEVKPTDTERLHVPCANILHCGGVTSSSDHLSSQLDGSCHRDGKMVWGEDVLVENHIFFYHLL